MIVARFTAGRESDAQDQRAPGATERGLTSWITAAPKISTSRSGEDDGGAGAHQALLAAGGGRGSRRAPPGGSSSSSKGARRDRVPAARPSSSAAERRSSDDGQQAVGVDDQAELAGAEVGVGARPAGRCAAAVARIATRTPSPERVELVGVRR